MELQTLTFIFVGTSFVIYIGIALWAKASTTGEFYIAGGGVHPVFNGMATAADWMSAASFISMAGLIAFLGFDASVYLMGWTGGYVLLAMLLAPYLRKYGKFTVPEFIGERYYSKTARIVAVVCLIFISFTYIAGQMRGVGIVFSRFLEVDINTGLMIGMGVVFVYAVLGGMKGITYTQVAQYCVLIFAYTVPAVFISLQITGNPIPQLGFGSTVVGDGVYMLDKLDQVVTDLGFSAYTQSTQSTTNLFFMTLALMAGTAGLPHVIVRFFTVPKVSDARKSAGYALVFIALLYTVAPAVGSMARLNLIETINGPNTGNGAGAGTAYQAMPSWFNTWENSGLLAWYDHNHDGKIQYAAGNPLADKKPLFAKSNSEIGVKESTEVRGELGQRVILNPGAGKVAEGAPYANELYVDRDIMVLANPEIAGLPAWVIALIAAGGIAAALSTAAGLLLVISSSISHDLLKSTFAPNISEKQELMYGRIAITVAILIAGYLGANPPGWVAETVAMAFGLAASSLFPAILLGIFSVRMNRTGAIAGMLTGLLFTFCYIIYFKGVFIEPFAANIEANWLFGITPQAIGGLGMILNFVVALSVSYATKPPPERVQALVLSLRIPRQIGVQKA